MMALQLFRESKTLFPLSTQTEVRLVHPLKANSPILFTVLGMIKEVRPLQPLNALNVDNQYFAL